MEVYIPKEILQPFVSMFYTVIGSRKPGDAMHNELALPSGHCFMVYRCKGNMSVAINDKDNILPRFYIAGQQTSSHYMKSNDLYIELVVAALKPTALWHFFGLNMSELVNEAIPLDTIYQGKLLEIRKQFERCKTAEERIGCLEKVLIDASKKKTLRLNVIDISIDIIQKNKGCILIKDLVGKLNISKRYFQKKFKEMVGISPSVYTRITRFNYLFAEIGTSQQDYKTLSTFFNYHDISHFSKDFKNYCGESPTKFHLEKFKFLKDIWVDDPLILKMS